MTKEEKLGHTGGSDCPCYLCARPQKQMSSARAGLVLRLQEWSRNCLIDGFKMDKGEPTLQALLREAATILMRSRDETTRDDASDAVRYRWLRDWYHREGKRAEIDPYGHIAVRTLPEWEALLDAAIARSSSEEPTPGRKAQT